MVRLDDLMHRRLILETLKERDDHPTAEQIYFYVRAQADSVSRAAVYRNLRALQAQGEVVRVGQTGPERFDHIVHPHHHILCTNCGKLSNAPVDYQRKLDLEAADATDYIVSRHYLLFEGICPDCQKWAIDQCLGDRSVLGDGAAVVGGTQLIHRCRKAVYFKNPTTLR